MGDEHLRCFIAISLPQQLKTNLSHIQRLVRQQRGITAGFPRWENLHLTLLFLGNISYETIGLLTASMDSIAQQEHRFSIFLSRLGTFPGHNRPARVLWAGIDGEINILNRIYHRLKTELASKNVVLDRQKFSPHITIARFKKSPRSNQIKDIISQADVSGEIFQVQGIDLYQSELTPQGAIYTLMNTSALS